MKTQLQRKIWSILVCGLTVMGVLVFQGGLFAQAVKNKAKIKYTLIYPDDTTGETVKEKSLELKGIGPDIIPNPPITVGGVLKIKAEVVLDKKYRLIKFYPGNVMFSKSFDYYGNEWDNYDLKEWVLGSKNPEDGRYDNSSVHFGYFPTVKGDPQFLGFQLGDESSVTYADSAGNVVTETLVVPSAVTQEGSMLNMHVYKNEKRRGEYFYYSRNYPSSSLILMPAFARCGYITPFVTQCHLVDVFTGKVVKPTRNNMVVDAFFEKTASPVPLKLNFTWSGDYFDSQANPVLGESFFKKYPNASFMYPVYFAAADNKNIKQYVAFGKNGSPDVAHTQSRLEIWVPGYDAQPNQGNLPANPVPPGVQNPGQNSSAAGGMAIKVGTDPKNNANYKFTVSFFLETEMSKDANSGCLYGELKVVDLSDGKAIKLFKLDPKQLNVSNRKNSWGYPNQKREWIDYDISMPKKSFAKGSFDGDVGGLSRYGVILMVQDAFPYAYDKNRAAIPVGWFLAGNDRYVIGRKENAVRKHGEIFLIEKNKIQWGPN